MTITEAIKHHVRKKGRGYVFTPNSFRNISHRNTIDKLLSRLSANGYFRSIGWGLYDYPVFDENTQQYLEPQLDPIIKALEVRFGVKLQYGGEYSAYLMGIIKDKPKQLLYLGNTNMKQLDILSYNITIKPTRIPSTKNKNDLHILAIQSLIYLGKQNTTSEVISKILKQLDKKELVKFKKISKFAPVWVSNVLKGYV